MNKILKFLILFLVLLFAFDSAVFAQGKVKFIYVHGTNDNNYKKKKEFTEIVNGLHKEIVTEFSQSEKVQKYLLEDGKYTISETPIVFYWGAESRNDLNLLADWLDMSKFFSPKMAQTVRTAIAHTFHDAIWIQKYNNMKPVLDKLHKITESTEEKGDKFVLVGHSAGTFITYEYYLYKLPYIDLKEFFVAKNLSADKLKEVQKIGYRTTCVDALLDSGLVIYKRDNTTYIPNENFINNYKKLPQYEATSCLNPDVAAGMINFGSPLALFYSGFSNGTEIGDDGWTEGVMNNNIFYLNLNFSDDPLGFPLMDDSMYSQMIAFAEDRHINYGAGENQKHGFMYDKSDLKSAGINVINAHNAYWKKSKVFAKAIVKAYEEGLEVFTYKPN